MMVRPATCAMRRAARAAPSVFQRSQVVVPAALTSVVSQQFPPGALRLASIATYRDLSTSATRNKNTRFDSEEANELLQNNADVRAAFDGEFDARVGELLEMIEQSREEGDSERELEESVELYDILKQRNQQDTETCEVAFGIARIYDEQLEDGATATTYYGEALEILEAVSTEATAWGAYMRVTTLGALAVCYENLGQPEEAEKYFDDAIGAYEEHCNQASASDAGELDVPDADFSLLADLNATAAMIHYHYAANLLAQDRWEEAKNVTSIALVLAENSSMPSEDLEELQQCIHELWLEME